MKLINNWILCDDDQDVTPEMEAKIWKRAQEIFEESRTEIEEAERELESGGGVLLKDALERMKPLKGSEAHG